MTGYTVHTGSSEKFSEGWDRIFQESGRKKSTAKKKTGGKAAAQKGPAKRRKKK